MIRIILLLLLFFSVLHGQTDTVKINSINFTGNKNFGTGTLHNLMSLQPSTWFTTYYFNADIFKDDLNSIKTFYHNEGFPDFKIAEYKLQYNDDSSGMDISIQL